MSIVDEDPSRIPAYTRLRSLPPVFDLRDVSMTFDWDANLSRVFCTRLSTRGLVQKSGPKTGIYYNLIVDPEGPERRLGEVLKKYMPSAVIIGSSALHAGEWTTQRPHVLEVAMPRTRNFRTCPQFDGAHIVFRDRYWYETVAKELRTDPLQRSLKSLSPAAALADAWVNRDVWDPDPDDIQIEDARDLENLQEWMSNLGMDEDEARLRIENLEKMHWGGLSDLTGRGYESWEEEDSLDSDDGFTP